MTGHIAEPREHGGWNRCRQCKHDGPCPCSGEPCCDRFLLCGHCPKAPGHIDECCILLEYPDLLTEVEDLRTEVEHLRHVIHAAAEDIEQWGAYASQYFREKWGLRDDINRYLAFAQFPTVALIEEFHEPSGDQPPHCLIDGQAHPCAAVRLARAERPA